MQSNAQLKDVPAEDIAFSYLPSYIAMMNAGYKPAKHTQLLCRYLHAVESGKINRLMIFEPPRCGKTMHVSEYFPAWYLGRNPERQIIASTYSYERATDIGREVRNQMLDPTFQNIFPGCQISSDAKAANKFNTSDGGIYFSVGTKGAVTGRGAHLFLIDDPVKGAEDADSESEKRKLRAWFKAVAYTRLMPGNSAIVLVMTRWRYDDLAGWLLKETAHENWTVLNLPALATSKKDPIGREVGEPLWPEAYPWSALKRTKKTIGSRDWNALYQQNPIAEEGGIIQLDWLERNKYETRKIQQWRIAAKMGARDMEAPFGIKQVVCSWDTASKETQLSDPTACTVWGIAKDKFYLLYVIDEKFEYPALKKRVHKVWEENMKFGLGPVPVLIEDKGSGQSLIQDLKKASSIPVIAIPAETSKAFRLEKCSILFESDRVSLPEKADWLVDYETQLLQFPFGAFDDQADSTSQFLNWAAGKGRRRTNRTRYWK